MIYRDDVIKNGVIGGLIGGILSAIVCFIFSIASFIADLTSVCCPCCCIAGLIFNLGSIGISFLVGAIGGFISASLLKKTVEEEFLKNSGISGSIAGFIVGVISAIATLTLSFLSTFIVGLLYALGVAVSEDKAASALSGVAMFGLGLLSQIAFFILIAIVGLIGGLIGGVIGGAVYKPKK